MPNLDDYKTEHLFLLIGGNPLPNYVAAKLLAKAKENGQDPTIYLVFSEGNNGTKEYADKLREVLEQGKYCLKNLPVIPASQFSIYDNVKNKVINLKNNGETSIGLNYTGGTKAMAVHAYRAIKENCGGNITPIFSYLDSREMKMCIDRENRNNRVEFKLYDSNQPYFEDTKISLDDLLKLHGLEKSRALRQTTKHPDVMNAIYDEVTQNLDRWEMFRSGNRGQSVSLTGLNHLPKVLDGKGLVESGNLDFTKFSDGREAEEFRKYLNGKWLEDFVLERILDVKKIDNALGNYGASLDLIHPQNRSLSYFETDNVVLRGYQLFIITCSYIATTQSLSNKKNPYKQKIFEALLRAEQIGGSEARVALVCMASNSENHRGNIVDLVNKLKEELDDKRIIIFGKEDIQDSQRFTNKLKGWFESR